MAYAYSEKNKGRFSRLIVGESEFPSSKETLGFLVGTYWYSADQGEMPNTYEFPKQFIQSFEKAEELFLEESSKNHSWGCGGETAYIAPVYKDGEIGRMCNEIMHMSEA